MTFDHPWVLGALAVFIPLVFFDIFGSPRKYRHRLSGDLEKKLKVSIFLFRVFIACAIIALAGPRWGMGFTVSEYRRGLDVVFAIDVSRSMDIRDAHSAGTGQSRLERGLFIAGESAAAVPGARFAAAIGRSRGYLALPLTWDNEVILSFLETLDGSSMTGRSTNLESLIGAAASAFQNSFPARKAIILVSDGEALAGSLKNALDKCVRDGIIVSAIAVGSDEGRPVPAENGFTESSGIISRREAAVMRMAAERTGGVYIDGNRDDAAGILSAHLLSLAQETGPGSGRSEPKERRTLFIILAIIAYGASKFVPLLPRLKFGSILAMVFILSSCSQGKLLLMEANYLNSRGRYDEAVVPYLKALNYEDAAPYAEYGLGLTFYSLDESTAALKRYGNSQKLLEALSAGEHRELRYRNNYNSGIVFFAEGDFQAAAAAFRDALREDSRKMEAKRNLELSLMSLAKETAEGNRTGQQENKTKEILFDYLKQKEQQQWKSREWTPEEKTTEPDY